MVGWVAKHIRESIQVSWAEIFNYKLVTLKKITFDIPRQKEQELVNFLV